MDVSSVFSAVKGCKITCHLPFVFHAPANHRNFGWQASTLRTIVEEDPEGRRMKIGHSKAKPSHKRKAKRTFHGWVGGHLQERGRIFGTNCKCPGN